MTNATRKKMEANNAAAERQEQQEAEELRIREEARLAIAEREPIEMILREGKGAHHW